MGNTLYDKRAFLGSEWIEGLKKTGNGYVKTPRPGRAGLGHAPTALGSDIVCPTAWTGMPSMGESP